MHRRNGSSVSPHPDIRALGVLSGDRIVAGVTYQDFNGVNVICEIAARPRALWAREPVLRQIFGFPFLVLGCHRITIGIEDRNELSLRLCRRLGFVEEARLQAAASDRGDVVVLRLFREECRWIEHGQEDQGSAAG